MCSAVPCCARQWRALRPARCTYVACCVLHAACCMLRVARCVCTLRVACCVLHVARCVLHAALCVLHAACCTLRVACCTLRVACCTPSLRVRSPAVCTPSVTTSHASRRLVCLPACLPGPWHRLPACPPPADGRTPCEYSEHPLAPSGLSPAPIDRCSPAGPCLQHERHDAVRHERAERAHHQRQRLAERTHRRQRRAGVPEQVPAQMWQG